MDFRCKYCDVPIRPNKQGVWGYACSVCKGTLTRMLRSGAASKESLLRARYDWVAAEWSFARRV